MYKWFFYINFARVLYCEEVIYTYIYIIFFGKLSSPNCSFITHRAVVKILSRVARISPGTPHTTNCSHADTFRKGIITFVVYWKTALAPRMIPIMFIHNVNISYHTLHYYMTYAPARGHMWSEHPRSANLDKNTKHNEKTTDVKYLKIARMTPTM